LGEGPLSEEEELKAVKNSQLNNSKFEKLVFFLKQIPVFLYLKIKIKIFKIYFGRIQI
jgi:hypothetical protein